MQYRELSEDTNIVLKDIHQTALCLSTKGMRAKATLQLCKTAYRKSRHIYFPRVII